jgi:hypothetical protein
MVSTLRRRFESFVRTLDGFEHIDALLKHSKNLDRKQRADYLFQGRQIIVEQKTLVSDPIRKPQKVADKIMRERGIVAYGTVSTRRIFSSQPDANSLQSRLVLSIGRTIHEVVAKADKQTRDTRSIFDLPDAVGAIVLLNEGAGMLAPEIIGYVLSNTFQERDEEGAPRYKHNDAVIGISEVQTVPVPEALQTYPINTFTNPHSNRAAMVDTFADMLIARWAAFNDARLIINDTRQGRN